MITLIIFILLQVALVYFSYLVGLKSTLNQDMLKAYNVVKNLATAAVASNTRYKEENNQLKKMLKEEGKEIDN